MYTLEQLQQKTLKELKEIGWQLNVLPEGDRRCRQNWIDVLAGVQPPLLQLLEVSPAGVETVPEAIEPVQEAIEVQAQEPPLESKLDRIIYPKVAAKPIAPAAETSPGVENFTEADRPPNRGDNGRDRLESESKVSQSAIVQEVKSLDAEPDLNPILTSADSWNAAELGEVLHATEPSGQMNFLQWDTDEPPEPDDFDLMVEFHAAYDLWLLTSELHEIIHTKNDSTTGTDTQREGAREIPIDAPATSGGDICSQHDGTSLARHDEGLGSQEGDRILEVTRPNSGDSGRVISHQPAQLVAPQAYENEQRPPGRDDGRGDLELAVGMLVGRRRDRLHIGKILDIYRSRRGIWRAKIQPLNKPNFVYFDCSALVEQRLLYDYKMKPGGFLPSGTVFDKNRGENFEVYSIKVRSAKPTTWTPGQLSEISTFKLKQIAEKMELFLIPGRAGKHSLIRAILAHQIILQEKVIYQSEEVARSTMAESKLAAQKQKYAAPKNKKKSADNPPLGHQLSLFDVAV
jgi:hypothetical protein